MPIPTQSDPLTELMDRLSRQPDLPSLPSLMPEVRRLARCERSRVQALSAVLLKDPGLSQRLLRLVNASFYRTAGAGQIVTITRAIAVMGFDAVGRLAVAARLIDALLQRDASMDLREDCLRALLAAMLADQLAEGRRDTEDAYLAALFRNLGRMLVALHLPQARRSARSAVPADRWPCSDEEDAAARRPLGQAFSEIGRRLAGQWGWPPLLAQSMVRDAGAGRFGTPALAALADDLADLLLRRPSEQWPAACHALVRHPEGPGVARLEAALGWARLRVPDLAALLELPLSRFPAWGGRGQAAAAEAGRVGDHDAIAPADQETVAPEGPAELMSQAIQDLSAALVEGGDALESAPALALEALWRGLDARAALLCIRRPDGSLHGAMTLMQGRLPDWHVHCRVDPDKGDDLFALLCRRGVDTAIEDAREPRIAQRLPGWFRAGPDARRFMVLPMHSRGVPLGMIYLDADAEAQLRPDAHRLRLARSLRNQLMLALPAPSG